MKINFKFFIIVFVILLVSSIVLTACMNAKAVKNAIEKNFDKSREINKDSNVPFDNSTPKAQTEIQKKFSAMYDISDDGKIIEVISTDYLYDYWKSNYEKETIHSLSTDEVYFIIQDSVRVYFNYDKVILNEFASVSSIKQVADRFPFVKSQEISRLSDILSPDRDKIEEDILKIIIYRLTSLSSPKAFITGAEVNQLVIDDSTGENMLYPETVFYIPGYSDKTDREYVLSILGGSTSFTDLERFTDLFIVSEDGSNEINFSSIATGTTTKVFPTNEVTD